jgi:molybdopterin-guanine dinucleotide biosynthesis protein A
VAEVSALILAAGASRRMGRDKAWVSWRGRPLWQHVLSSLRAQSLNVGEVWVNVRPSAAAWADVDCTACGLTGLLPEPPEYAGCGPLSGMRAGLIALARPWLLVLPCDVPRLPHDLLARLQAANAPVAYAATSGPDGERAHPTIALLHHSALAGIEAQLASADHKLMRGLQRSRHRSVVWHGPGVLHNVNDPSDLAALEAMDTPTPHALPPEPGAQGT